MEDFRVKTSWRTSRKRRRLKRQLGADGVLAIEDLWSYCAAERTDGDLTGLTNEDIADEVAWEGDSDELVRVLVACELLDGAPGSYTIHDWHEHNPYVATGAPRSDSSAYSAHIRWHVKRNETKGGCPWCDANAYATDATQCDRIAIDANRNAPTNHTNLPTNHVVVEKPGSVSVADLEKKPLGEWPGWRGMTPAQKRHLDKLAPFTPQEVAWARSEVERAGDNPNFGLFTSKIKGDRRRKEPKASGAGPPVRKGYIEATQELIEDIANGKSL